MATARLEQILLEEAIVASDRIMASGEHNVENYGDQIRAAEQNMHDLAFVTDELTLRTDENNEARDQSNLDQQIENQERYRLALIAWHKEAARGQAGQEGLNESIDDAGAFYNLADKRLDQVTDAVGSYSEAVLESMDETAQAVKDNVVSWDEWAGDIEINTAKVLEGLNMRLQAERDFFIQIEQGLAKDASPAVVDFLNLLDSESKFGFLKLSEADQTAFITDLETSFGNLNAFITEKLTADLPEILKLEGDALLLALGGIVEEIVADPDTSISAVDAWKAVLEAALVDASPELRDELLAVFGDETSIKFIGNMFSIGVDGAMGIIKGLESKYGAAATAGRILARKVSDAAKGEFKAESPSKVFMGIGQDVAAGLVMGIDSGISDFAGINVGSRISNPNPLGPQVNSITNSNETANAFNLSVTGSRDPAADGQTLLLAAKLAGRL